MARYIDADKSKELIKEYSERLSPLSSVCEKSLTVALNAIDLTPAADVVPKSEVAREIFKEMQSCLVMRHWVGHDILSFEFDAVKYSELKKKYTEEKEGEGK